MCLFKDRLWCTGLRTLGRIAVIGVLHLAATLDIARSQDAPQTSADQEFDCREFISLVERVETSSADPAWSMSREIDHRTAIVGHQWVCLKNGSVTERNVDYLKVSEMGKHGRRHPNLMRLKRWAASLFDDLSDRNRADQVAIMERVSQGLAGINEEEKIFAELLRDFKRNHLSLENFIIMYSLSDITASDLEVLFQL